MASLRLVAGLALVTACYQPAADTFPTQPEPTAVEGPPGGAMDPQWQAGYVDDNAAGGGADYADAAGEPSADPADAQSGTYVMGQVADGEIDATLDGYGEWVQVDGYGEVWRPYTTVVGVDFTPYETCGSWVWTDWGWTYACDWDWGWLPFHYGRWGWFDDYWAWVPDYEWSPAWVEWRGGGGYTGWRPLAPIVRDHRGQHNGLVVHDHRHGSGPQIRDHRKARTKDWQWRFAMNDDFGKPRIRAHLMKSLAEGLRATSIVARPQVRATVQPVRAESIMRARLAVNARLHGGATGGSVMTVGGRGALGASGPVRGGVTDWRGADRGYRPSRSSDGGASPSVYAPTYPSYGPRGRSSAGGGGATPSAPEQTYGGLPVQPTTPTPTPPDTHPSAPIYPAQTEPTRGPEPIQSPEPTVSHPRPPTYTAPTQPSYQPPVYQPPVYQPRAPIYTPPAPTTRAPTPYSPPTYSPPTYSPPTYSPPAHYSPPPSYSPPAHYSPPAAPSHSYSSSYSAPSHSSSSYSAPSHSNGGGGGVRRH